MNRTIRSLCQSVQHNWTRSSVQFLSHCTLHFLDGKFISFALLYARLAVDC